MNRVSRILMLNAAVFVFLCAMISYFVFFQTNFSFPVRHIKVYGHYPHIEKTDIEHLMAPYMHLSFFNVDLGTIKKTLLHLPWLQSVSVSRVWPSTIIITLKERIPVAVWNGDHLMTEEAVIFSANVENFLNSLPIFLGPHHTEELMLKKYREFNAILSPLDLHIHQLRLTSSMVWCIRLDNGIELMLGENDIQERLLRFVSVYTKIITSSHTRAKRFDLRYPDGVAVAWQ